MAGFKYFAFAGDEQKITVTLGGNAEGSLHVKSQLDGEDLADMPFTLSMREAEALTLSILQSNRVEKSLKNVKIVVS